jgi:hypothetical protein
LSTDLSAKGLPSAEALAKADDNFLPTLFELRRTGKFFFGGRLSENIALMITHGIKEVQPKSPDFSELWIYARCTKPLFQLLRSLLPLSECKSYQHDS